MNQDDITEKSNHEIAAESQPYDDHGHFASPRQSSALQNEGGPNSSATSALKKLITPSVSKTHSEFSEDQKCFATKGFKHKSA